MSPFYLAFDHLLNLETGSAHELNVVSTMDLCVDFLFLTDICMNFFLMYVDDAGELVYDHWTIVRRYLLSWFVPDFMSSVPWSLMFNTISVGAFKLLRFGRFAKVFKLLRFFRMFRLLKLVKWHDRFDKLFQKVVMGDKYHSEPPKAYQFSKFCTVSLIAGHVAGCIWYAVARHMNSSGTGWIEALWDENERNLFEHYIFSTYFIITTFTTVGYGDITATSIPEELLAIVLMMVGVMLYSMAIGTITNIILQEDQHETVVGAKLHTLALFGQATDMDFSDYSLIRKHLKQKYEHSMDWLQGASDFSALLDDLPALLHAKLLQNMHRGTHMHLDFFKRYNTVNESFLTYTSPLLSSSDFDVGDMVYISGDYAERMYFLTRGAVAFLDDDNLGHLRQRICHVKHSGSGAWDGELEWLGRAKPFVLIRDGTTFGEYEVLFSVPRQSTTRSSKRSQCLVLHKRDLLQVLAEFPAIAASMRSDAQAQSEKMRRWKLDARRTRRRISRSVAGIDVAGRADGGGDFEDFSDADGDADEVGGAVGAPRAETEVKPALPAAPESPAPLSLSSRVGALERALDAAAKAQAKALRRDAELEAQLAVLASTVGRLDLRIQAFALSST